MRKLMRTLPMLLLALNGAIKSDVVLARERELTLAEEIAPSEGDIPVLMYHEIACPTSRYAVCPEDLYKQLRFMHNKGFRAVTIDEYLRNDFSRLHEYEKPYLITFDDTPRSQFFFASNGSPSANSAIGVIETFREAYNVRVPAYFFAITSKPIFGEEHSERQKLQYLVTHDFGIGNHTASHTNLANGSVKSALTAFSQADESLDYLIGENWGAPKTAAFPYGALPSDSVREQLHQLLGYAALFHAFGGAAKQSTNPAFDITAINRYETMNTSEKPGGITFLLDRFPVVEMHVVTK